MELHKEILEELKEVAPYLATLKRDNIFTTPENYFQQLQSNILKKTYGPNVKPIYENVLQQKEHPFEIPGNYFEELPSNILSVIKSEEHRGIAAGPSSRRKRFILHKAWLAAASVAILAVASIVLIDQQKQQGAVSQQATAVISNLDNASLLENASEIDESVIIALLIEQGASNSNGDNEVNPQTDNSLIEISDIDAEWLDEI